MIKCLKFFGDEFSLLFKKLRCKRGLSMVHYMELYLLNHPLYHMKWKSAWDPMAPLSTPPCVVLRVYYSMDQWVPDATAGLIINYYTSLDQNEHFCSFQHPQRWPVVAKLRLNAPPTPHPLYRLSNTSNSPRGGSGTCLKTASASPWWPAELSQLKNQGHTCRGPRFYHNKDIAAASACN